MKYADIYDAKFLEAFGTKPVDCLTGYQQKMLEELIKLLDNLFMDNLVLFLRQREQDENKKATYNRSALIDESEHLGACMDFAQLAASVREKSATQGFYDADSSLLTANEVFFLLQYQICSRMGGPFVQDFAEDGSLGFYLRLLKEKDISKNCE